MDSHQISFDGTTFIVDPKGVTIKKNGLSMNFTHDTFDKFIQYISNIAYSNVNQIIQNTKSNCDHEWITVGSTFCKWCGKAKE